MKRFRHIPLVMLKAVAPVISPALPVKIVAPASIVHRTAGLAGFVNDRYIVNTQGVVRCFAVALSAKPEDPQSRKW